MHAIIKQGNGKYYVSAVFGCYNNVNRRIYSRYYIVWDEKKEHLIKWYYSGFNQLMIIVDKSEENWITDEEGIGGIDFLPKETADRIVDTGEMPQDIREKCLAVDEGFVYEEYHEIKNERDIENLQYASGYFHDAYIEEQKLLEDGTLYLLFEGVWGCSIEVWFWGDLEYYTSGRDLEVYDPYWLDSSLFFHDGFVYFTDGENMTADKIGEENYWFKARHMKYHIIPD